MPPAPIPIRQPLGRLASAAGLGSARFSPVVRAVLASAKSVFEPDRNAYRVARAAWPGDRQTLDFVTRAASTPATTTGTGWAAEIAHTVVEDLLVSLGPASAGSELLRRGTVLTFDGAAKLTEPRRRRNECGVCRATRPDPRSTALRQRGRITRTT